MLSFSPFPIDSSMCAAYRPPYANRPFAECSALAMPCKPLRARTRNQKTPCCVLTPHPKRNVRVIVIKEKQESCYA